MAKEMDKTRWVMVAMMLAGLALAPLQGRANAADGAFTPLVTIRFNQPRVYFDQQLYSAVSKAFEVKPDAQFDVVSFAPSTGNPQADKQWQSLAGRNTRAVLAVMMQMGVPMERIHVTGKSQTGLRYDETQVFVR